MDPPLEQQGLSACASQSSAAVLSSALPITCSASISSSMAIRLDDFARESGRIKGVSRLTWQEAKQTSRAGWQRVERSVDRNF